MSPRSQLLRITYGRGDGAPTGDSWDKLHDDIFSSEYLLTRPLLEAISSDEPTVLLIDEIDKVDFEFEALLLEVLSDFQVSVPELGTVTAVRRPYVVLTSNNTRELSEALKRRCLYLHMDYPDVERERDIVLARVPGVSRELADQLVRIVRSLRQLDLRKPPAISETLDWAQALLELGHASIDAETAKATLSVVLKHRSDLAKALAHLEAS